MILLAQELYGYPLDPGVGGVQVLSRVPVVLPQSTYQGIKGGEHNTSLTRARIVLGLYTCACLHASKYGATH